MSLLTPTRNIVLPGQAVSEQSAGQPFPRILAVEFRSAEGRACNAIGGGVTVTEAIIDARESCPDNASWDAVSWNDLYGD